MAFEENTTLLDAGKAAGALRTHQTIGAFVKHKTTASLML